MAGGAAKAAASRRATAFNRVAVAVAVAHVLFFGVRYGLKGAPISGWREWAALLLAVVTQALAGKMYVEAYAEHAPAAAKGGKKDAPEADPTSAPLDVLGLATGGLALAAFTRWGWVLVWMVPVATAIFAFGALKGLAGGFSGLAGAQTRNQVLEAAGKAAAAMDSKGKKGGKAK